MRTLILTMLLSVVSVSVGAQQAAPPRTKAPPVAPSPEQLEPAVDTTATTATTSQAPPSPAPASQPPAAAPAAAPGSTPAAKAAPRGAKGADRVELETTDITGNRELPKVLYIVPWKRSDLGDLVGKPPNSLLDEVLQPIDREVFLRENRYYDAVKPDAAAGRPGTVPGSGDKP